MHGETIKILNFLLMQFTTVLFLQQRFTCSCRYFFCRYRQIFMEVQVWENLLPASFGIEDCRSGVFQNAANRLPYKTHEAAVYIFKLKCSFQGGVTYFP